MMKIETKREILDVLAMPEDKFRAEVMPEAAKAREAALGHELTVMAMLGYSNICKNMCLYCGMRAANNTVPRYRVCADDVINTVSSAADHGLTRIFLISGEDPKYGFDNLLAIVRALKAKNMFITLACGEYSAEQYAELHAAGAAEYVIKFEMSHEESFDRLNPSTNFKKRMAAIEAVKKSGMLLASGNIVDWPGQTSDELADDILLMKKLDISWAPIIPYMPAANTPLAAEGKRGSTLVNLKEIAMLRLMMPGVNITAQQPGEDLRNGLADEKGNLDAIAAGANVMFCDLLPDAKARSFRVIDDRNITGMDHIYRIAELSGMQLRL